MKNLFKKIIARSMRNPRMRKLSVDLFRSFLLKAHGFPPANLFLCGYRWYYLNLAQTLRQSGDSRGALDILLLGISNHPNNHQCHIRISQIFRANHDITGAHRHLEAADQLKPGINTITKLIFESEHGLFEEGAKTMLKVLELSQKLIRPQLNMIDRVSIHYPEHREKIIAVRHEITQGIMDRSYDSSKSLSKAVAELIGQRQIKQARELCVNGGIAGMELSPVIRQRLDRILKPFGENSGMLETAWKNENSEETYFFINGNEIPSTTADPGPLKVVEFFIPPAIFDYPAREKPTHETIRETFLNIIGILCSRTDIAIIPRMQLNWRECRPKTIGSHVMSYHTSADFNRRHLHIQESPFAGYCSFDHSGFAGFSGIASNHEEISRFVGNISSDQLDLNQSAMYEKYVTHNISKYRQPENSKPIEGPYVFVALQVITDVVVKLAWMSGTELLESVASYYRGTGTRVVVKRHPFCRSMKVQKCIKDLEATGDIIETSNSIHEILRNAELVFTVNSGVGLEALVHGKSVIVSGACDYSYATKQARNPAELYQILENNPITDDKRIKELLYFYTHSYAISSTDTNRLEERISEWLNG